MPPSRSSTPAASKLGAQASFMGKKSQHGKTVKSDIECIRALVTCSICDQLLYEPWTIACGHTYCYSCLCSWFSQDKRNKTCPECRSRVEAIPAPSFLIKQLVDVVLVRSKFTAVDESVEQHQKKKTEEIALVDKDKNSSQGLFQGMFAKEQNKLWRDDSDGVLRCPSCGFEHEGGQVCAHCGEEINDEDHMNDYDEVDMDSTDYETMGFALEVDSDDESFYPDSHVNHFHQNNVPHTGLVSARYESGHYGSHYHWRVRDDFSDGTDSEATETSVASDSNEGNTDDDEENSIDDFIVPDDDEDDFYNTTTTAPTSRLHNNSSSGAHLQNSVAISDDDSDEGGAISNRRQRRRFNNPRGINLNNTSPVPSALTITDVSTIEFECDDHGNEAESVSRAGWSPLDLDDISDEEDRQNTSYYPSSNNFTSTEAMNNISDDEYKSDERDSNLSETPTYRAPGRHSSHHIYECSNRVDPEPKDSHLMDIDEDTDMSISPQASRNSRNEITSGSNSRVSSVGAPLASISQNSSSSSISTEHEANSTRIRNWHNSTRNNQNLLGIESHGINRTRRKRAAREKSSNKTLETKTRRNRPWSGSTVHNSYQRGISSESSASRSRANSLATDIHSNVSSNSSGENLGEVNEIHELDEESDDSIQPPSRRRPRKLSSSSSSKFNSHFTCHQINLNSSQEKYYYESDSREMYAGINCQRNILSRSRLPCRVSPHSGFISTNEPVALITSSRAIRLSRGWHNYTSLYH